VRDSILSQIRTIQQVDGDRYVWPHILDEVSRALPPFTWLVNVAFVPLTPKPTTFAAADSAAAKTDTLPPPVQVQLTGRTWNPGHPVHAPARGFSCSTTSRYLGQHGGGGGDAVRSSPPRTPNRRSTGSRQFRRRNRKR
jgi:hypothetical protein